MRHHDKFQPNDAVCLLPDIEVRCRRACRDRGSKGSFDACLHMLVRALSLRAKGAASNMDPPTACGEKHGKDCKRQMKSTSKHHNPVATLQHQRSKKTRPAHPINIEAAWDASQRSWTFTWPFNKGRTMQTITYFIEHGSCSTSSFHPSLHPLSSSSPLAMSKPMVQIFSGVQVFSGET